MRDVPEWITRIVETEDLYCNKCKGLFKKDDLISVGVQQSSVMPYDNKLCIGMFCLTCREITIFELKDMSLVEFAFEILERETETGPKNNKKLSSEMMEQDIFSDTKKRKKRRLVSNKSKITKKDLNEAVRFLRKIGTHEEFLVAMGMSPEQISQYSYKKFEEE